MGSFGMRVLSLGVPIDPMDLRVAKMKGLYIDVAWYDMIWHVQDEVSGFGMWEPFFLPCVLMFLSGPARGSSRFSRGRDRKKHEGYSGLPAEGWQRDGEWEPALAKKQPPGSVGVYKHHALCWQLKSIQLGWFLTTNSIQLCESPSNILQGKSWYIHNSGNIMASPLNHLWVIGLPSVALAS